MIRQICYLSAARDGVREADIQCILGAARHHNRGLQVSGLLAAGGGVFFQVLEGPRDNVERVMRRIRRDARHSFVRILQDEMIASRDFGAWPMAFRTIDATAAATIAATIAAGQTGGDPVVAMLAALGHRTDVAMLPGVKLAA